MLLIQFEDLRKLRCFGGGAEEDREAASIGEGAAPAEARFDSLRRMDRRTGFLLPACLES